MRVEIVAVGTELLLGQIADTNSAWLGDRLAAAGVTSHFHQAVGDNHERITLAFRTALARSDGIIVCGGLGPDAGRHHPRGHRRCHGRRARCATRPSSTSSPASSQPGAATMSANNARQADVPEGATIIPQRTGTAPGLICPLGNKVIYAVPGVPLRDGGDVRPGHPARPARPHGRRRRGERHRQPGAAHLGRQRVRDWPSRCRAASTPSTREVDESTGAGTVTLAFLASGMEGIKVRITAKARHRGRRDWPCSTRRRRPCGPPSTPPLGDIVFGVDDESMEVAVAAQLLAHGLTLGVAESLTGGLIASRLVNVPGASAGSGAAWWPTTSR